jgi:hypothetical protein
MKKPPPQPQQGAGYLDGMDLPDSDSGDSDHETVEREEKLFDVKQQVSARR